jgi:Arc/MetJ-type ribon-helix-helix transcriptional regulator
MSTVLSPERTAEIEQIMRHGEYADADEVLAKALRLLREEDARKRMKAILARAADDVKNGRIARWTPELREQLRERAIERFNAGEKPSPDVCP